MVVIYLAINKRRGGRDIIVSGKTSGFSPHAFVLGAFV